MARVKKVIGRFGMEITYDVVETTTHKTTLDNGMIIRSDLNGLYIAENQQGEVTSSWLGNKDFFWKFPTRETLLVEDCNWEEQEFTRNYQMEKDVS